MTSKSIAEIKAEAVKLNRDLAEDGYDPYDAVKVVDLLHHAIHRSFDLYVKEVTKQ